MNNYPIGQYNKTAAAPKNVAVKNHQIHAANIDLKSDNKNDTVEVNGKKFTQTTAFKLGIVGLIAAIGYFVYRGNVGRVNKDISNIATQYKDVIPKAEKPLVQAAETVTSTAQKKVETVKEQGLKIFETIEEAAEYLKKQFDIDAKFVNKKQANLVVESIEDMARKNSKDMFNGMIIDTYEAGESVLGQLSYGYNHDNEKIVKCILSFNEKFDWENVEKITQDCATKGHWPAFGAKTEIYHELGHWIDFMRNPKKYVQLHNDFEVTTRRFNPSTFSYVDLPNKYINNAGLARCAKVSNYAKTSPTEFKAEYIAGRMSGKNYSKDIEDMYFEFGGPKLNF